MTKPTDNIRYYLNMAKGAKSVTKETLLDYLQIHLKERSIDLDDFVTYIIEPITSKPIDLAGNPMLDFDEFCMSVSNINLKHVTLGYFASGNSIHDLIEQACDGSLQWFTHESLYRDYIGQQLSFAEYRELLDAYIEWGGEVYAMRMSPSVG